MPSKTTKRARRAAAKPNNAPIEKDDGSRWIVVRDGHPVYLSNGGVTKAQAKHLAEGLLKPAEMICVSVP